jgi:F0F1-type ATP synthase membrane subunit b/b'
MLRQDASAISPEYSGANNRPGVATGNVTPSEPSRTGGIDIQRELNRLEEMILDSPRILLSRRTLVDEEHLLEQLDLVRLNLPAAFQEATEITRHKEEILLEAEQYAQEIIESAERRAAQILDEMNLIRQAELEVQQLRQQAQRECESMQEQALADIDLMRRQAQQEIEELRRQALLECEDIQAGADAYADRVLRDMEHQLSDMIRVIRNGRGQLQVAPPSSKLPSNPGNRPSAPRSPQDRPKKQ